MLSCVRELFTGTAFFRISSDRVSDLTYQNNNEKHCWRVPVVVTAKGLYFLDADFTVVLHLGRKIKAPAASHID